MAKNSCQAEGLHHQIRSVEGVEQGKSDLGLFLHASDGYQPHSCMVSKLCTMSQPKNYNQSCTDHDEFVSLCGVGHLTKAVSTAKPKRDHAPNAERHTSDPPANSIAKLNLWVYWADIDDEINGPNGEYTGKDDVPNKGGKKKEKTPQQRAKAKEKRVVKRKKNVVQLNKQKEYLEKQKESGLLPEDFGPIIRGRGDYLEDLGGKLGKWAGRKASGVLSPLFDTILGWGQYTDVKSPLPIANNSIMGIKTPMANQVPSMHQSDESIIIRHREYVRDVDMTSAFQVATLVIDCIDPKSFPWLAPIADRYTQWKILGFVAEYKSLSSFTTASQPGMGSVTLSFRYDVDTLPPVNKMQANNAMYSVSGRPCDSLLAPLECDPNQTPLQPMYIHAFGLTPVELPEKFKYLYAYLDVVTKGAATDYPAAGELWFTYEFMFLKPTLPEPGALTEMYHMPNNPNPTGSESIIPYPETEDYDTLGTERIVAHNTIEFDHMMEPGTTILGLYTMSVGADGGEMTAPQVSLGQGFVPGPTLFTKAGVPYSSSTLRTVEATSPAASEGMTLFTAVYDGTGTMDSPPQIWFHDQKSDDVDGGDILFFSIPAGTMLVPSADMQRPTTKRAKPRPKQFNGQRLRPVKLQPARARNYVERTRSVNVEYDRSKDQYAVSQVVERVSQISGANGSWTGTDDVEHKVMSDYMVVKDGKVEEIVQRVRVNVAGTVVSGAKVREHLRSRAGYKIAAISPILLEDRPRQRTYFWLGNDHPIGKKILLELQLTKNKEWTSRFIEYVETIARSGVFISYAQWKDPLVRKQINGPMGEHTVEDDLDFLDDCSSMDEGFYMLCVDDENPFVQVAQLQARCQGYAHYRVVVAHHPQMDGNVVWWAGRDYRFGQRIYEALHVRPTRRWATNAVTSMEIAWINHMAKLGEFVSIDEFIFAKITPLVLPEFFIKPTFPPGGMMVHGQRVCSICTLRTPVFNYCDKCVSYFQIDRNTDFVDLRPQESKMQPTAFLTEQATLRGRLRPGKKVKARRERLAAMRQRFLQLQVSDIPPIITSVNPQAPINGPNGTFKGDCDLSQKNDSYTHSFCELARQCDSKVHQHKIKKRQLQGAELRIARAKAKDQNPAKRVTTFVTCDKDVKLCDDPVHYHQYKNAQLFYEWDPVAIGSLSDQDAQKVKNFEKKSEDNKEVKVQEKCEVKPGYVAAVPWADLDEGEKKGALPPLPELDNKHNDPEPASEQKLAPVKAIAESAGDASPVGNLHIAECVAGRFKCGRRGCMVGLIGLCASVSVFFFSALAAVFVFMMSLILFMYACYQRVVRRTIHRCDNRERLVYVYLRAPSNGPRSCQWRVILSKIFCPKRSLYTRNFFTDPQFLSELVTANHRQVGNFGNIIDVTPSVFNHCKLVTINLDYYKHLDSGSTGLTSRRVVDKEGKADSHFIEAVAFLGTKYSDYDKLRSNGLQTQIFTELFFIQQIIAQQQLKHLCVSDFVAPSFHKWDDSSSRVSSQQALPYSAYLRHLVKLTIILFLILTPSWYTIHLTRFCVTRPIYDHLSAPTESGGQERMHINQQGIVVKGPMPLNEAIESCLVMETSHLLRVTKSLTVVIAAFLDQPLSIMESSTLTATLHAISQYEDLPANDCPLSLENMKNCLSFNALSYKNTGKISSDHCRLMYPLKDLMSCSMQLKKLSNMRPILTLSGGSENWLGRNYPNPENSTKSVTGSALGG